MARSRIRRRLRTISAAKKRPKRRAAQFEPLEPRTLLTAQQVWVNGAWLDANTNAPASLTPGESVTDGTVTKTYGTDAFSTVPAGVAAVAAGGSVHIDPGTYVADVDVSQNLSIDSIGAAPAILQAQSTAAVTVESGATVSITGLTISNSLIGIRVNGGAVTIAGATISGNTIGLSATSGSAAVSGSQIYANSTGLRFAGGATGSINGNSFAGGASPNNSTDLLLAASAGSVTIGAGNSFAGTTTIDNQTSHTIDATAANSFAGVNLADLDPSSAAGLAGLYSIEDHVTDGLDHNGVGLVRLKASDLFVAASSEAAAAGGLRRAVSLAAAGDSVFVQAGTYLANANHIDAGAGLVAGLNIDKPLSLIGPNADFDPQASTTPSQPQAIILPAVSDPDPGTTSAMSIVNVQASNVTICGLTIDGDNPALAGDPNTVVYHSAAIDAFDGISCYAGVGNLTIDHNIIKNATYTGVDLENGSSAVGTANIVARNLIQNIGGEGQGFGSGVFLANNFYAAVTNNVIDTALIGVQTQGFTAANPGGPGTATVSHNTIAAVGAGIWYNDFSAAASPFDVSSNSITAVEDSASVGRWVGVLITSQPAAGGAMFAGNMIDGSATAGNLSQTTYGYQISSGTASGGPAISGGVISGVQFGVNVSGGTATIAGALIQNNGTGIYAHGGAALTISANSILGNATGIEIADDTLNAATNNIISGGQYGIHIDASAIAVGPIGGGNLTGNSIAGNSIAGLQNDSALSIDASGNWWGSADGPNSPANAYQPNNPAGDTVLGSNIVLAPWLTVGTNTASSANGFQPTALDAQPPILTDQADQTAIENISQSIALGSFADSDNAAGGPWHVAVDWGDGSPTESFSEEATGDLGARSHKFADEGQYNVNVSVVEQAGTTGSATFVVNVADAAPTITASSPSVSAVEGALAHNSGTYSDPDDGVDVSGPGVTDNHDGTWNWSGTGDEAHPYDVTVTAVNADGSQSSVTFHVSFTPPPTLEVTSFAGNASGFDVTFNRPVDVSRLNLYGGASGGLGLVDLTVVGQQTGTTVRGSLVWDAATNTAHFIATAGLLPPDTYSVDLASRSDGWTDLSGSPLDGLDSGVAGSGDYTNTFTVSAPTMPVLSLPDFARGPGQAVDVNRDGTARTPYLPVRLSDTSGLQSLSFEIDYDPTLLEVTGAQMAAGLPADWSATWQVTNSGGQAQLVVTASGTTALPAGARDVVDLIADVPGSAPYRAAQLLKPTNVQLNSGAIGAVVDEAVQKVAYFGDATGDGSLSSFDASFISRNVVQLDDGFSAYPLTDPRIIADVTGDGSISGLDASFVANASVGNSEPTIPAIPPHDGPAMSGIDPTVTIPIGYANPGGTVMLPINISEVNGLQGVDLAFSYDSSAVNIANADVSLASVFAADSWNITKNLTTPGLIRLSMYGLEPIGTSGPGTILNLTFHVPMTTASGSYPVSVLTDPIAPSTIPPSRLNEGKLTLSTVNGSIVVADPLNVVNTNDDGVGSLRHVIEHANTLPGSPHTITFALPAGPQTIQLLSQLSASTVPLVMQLDAGQDVAVVSPIGGGEDNYSDLTKVGAGSLTIAGASNLQGNIEVSDGALAFNVLTPPALVAGFTATIDGTGTLELEGTVSALSGGSSGATLVNNSTVSAGVLVNGTSQFAGGIDGTGTLAIADDGALTANHVVQGALVIGGSAGHLATLTIAASDAAGNPLATGQACQPDRTTTRAAIDESTLAPSAAAVPPNSPTRLASIALSIDNPVVLESLNYDIRASAVSNGRPTIATLNTEFPLATARFALAIDDSLIDLLALDHHRPHRGRVVVPADAMLGLVVD